MFSIPVAWQVEPFILVLVHTEAQIDLADQDIFQSPIFAPSLDDGGWICGHKGTSKDFFGNDLYDDKEGMTDKISRALEGLKDRRAS